MLNPWRKPKLYTTAALAEQFGVSCDYVKAHLRAAEIEPVRELDSNLRAAWGRDAFTHLAVTLNTPEERPVEIPPHGRPPQRAAERSQAPLPTKATVEVKPSTGKGPATFAGVAYSGGVVSRHTLKGLNLPHDYVLDLDGMESVRQPKATLDHKREQRVGHVAKVDNDGRRLWVDGVISAATEYSDRVARSTRNGYLWEVSIEADLAKPELIEAGRKQVVNGRTLLGPLFVFRRSVFTDVSFVDRGADKGNDVSIAASDRREQPRCRAMGAA